MTEHNIREAAAAAAGKLGKVAGIANLLGAGGGDKSKKDTDSSIGKTSGRLDVTPKQKTEELEVVCDFLLDKGYATTGVEAENIYEHMSDEWKEFILNS